MVVCENGVYRDATAEEIATWENHPPIEFLPTDSDRIDALESAIQKGMML